MEKIFYVEKGEEVKEITREARRYMLDFKCNQKVKAIRMWTDFHIVEGDTATCGKAGDYLILIEKDSLSHPNTGFDTLDRKTFEKEYSREEKSGNKEV